MRPDEILYDKIEHENLWERSVTLNRNDYLKRGGTCDTNVYFVENGSLRIFILEESEELTIRFGYQGNFITAPDSFIIEEPSDMYIQALKKTRVRVVSKSTYEKFIESSEENMKLQEYILKMLVYQQLERERDILIGSPLTRYLRVLKRSPQLFSEIPNKYIASYLRMTPETLSRLKKS